MWNNLTDDTRARAAASPFPPIRRTVADLAEDDDHLALFLQYFSDNCADATELTVWTAYWWLDGRNLSGGGYARRDTPRVDLDDFWDAFGPDGTTPVRWPAEIADWFADRAQWEAAIAADWDPAWDDDSVFVDADGEPVEPPGWAAHEALRREQDEWSRANPVPLSSAKAWAEERILDWYRAYADEVARMRRATMPATDLSLDYIVSLNTFNLDQLEVGAWHSCIGGGRYVLIGDFPDGYTAAVSAYADVWQGTVTMTARGRGLNPGSVTVTGCPAGVHQDGFTATFRKSSKKAIRFT
jgi:hypothetical protein